MSDKNTSSGPSDTTVAMLVMVFGLGILAKNIYKLENWARAHWFMLGLIALAVIFAVTRFMRWKFRMKHPEAYEREMAIKQLRSPNQKDRDNGYR